MAFTFKEIIHTRRLSLRSSVLLMGIVSVLIFICMILLAKEFTVIFYTNCFSHPLLILLNLAPIILLMAFLYGLTGHAPFSAAATTSVFLAGGITNRLMILLREEPLSYADLAQFKEGIGILKTFDASIFTAMIIGIVLVVLVFFALLIFFRPTKLKWHTRLILIILSVLLAFTAYQTIYTSTSIYNTYAIQGNMYRDKDVYSSKGWIYCFIYDIQFQSHQAPKNYQRKEFEEKEKEAADPAAYKNTAKPHVILIMDEAFTDLSENVNLVFNNYQDPLENYNRIAADAVVSGHIGVDTYGGGTAKTEFEVLTAIDIDALGKNVNPYDLIRSKQNSLASIFKSLGYDTAAIHAGEGWFYNRQNVFSHFGFDDFYCIGNGFSEDDEKKGGYISDAVTFAKIEETIEPYLEDGNDTPLFITCITIENHGGYLSKFGITEPNFDAGVILNDRQKNLLSNYFYGLIDSDIALNSLVEKLEKSDEPFIVVYWGDHYPSLEDVYDYTGYGYHFTESVFEHMNVFFTPFFIWGNDAAKNAVPLEENAENYDLGEDALFNAAFLGSTLLQLLDIEDLSPYMSYANEMRDTLPLSGWYGFIDNEGNISSTVPEKYAEAEELYEKWSYYMFFDR